MFFRCHKCSKPNDQSILKKDGNRIVCTRCGDVARENFVEETGAVAGMGEVKFDLNPGDYLFMQRSSDNPEENMNLIVSEVFHKQPYEGCKKIKSYTISFKYTIKVNYE